MELVGLPVGIPANISQGDPRLFRRLLGEGCQLLPPLLAQWRKDEPQDLAIILRVDSKIGFENGLFYFTQGTRVEGLDE